METMNPDDIQDKLRAVIDPEIGINIVDLFVEAKLGNTKSEVRRLIQQGGASVNSNRVTDISRVVDISDLADEDILLLRAGKKRFQRVKPQ